MQKKWMLGGAVVAAAVVGAALMSPAIAQFQPDPKLTTAPVHTVAAARKLADDTPVVLEGNIKRHIHGDQYEFTDATGSIEVEIEAKHWNGQVVNPNTRVRLTGEVDKDLISTEVEVKRLEIIVARTEPAAKPAGGFRPN